MREHNRWTSFRARNRRIRRKCFRHEGNVHHWRVNVGVFLRESFQRVESIHRSYESHSISHRRASRVFFFQTSLLDVRTFFPVKVAGEGSLQNRDIFYERMSPFVLFWRYVSRIEHNSGYAKRPHAKTNEIKISQRLCIHQKYFNKTTNLFSISPEIKKNITERSKEKKLNRNLSSQFKH